MQRFTEILESVKSNLAEDQSAKINPFLKELEAEFNDVLDSLKAANAESKNRKLKLRELEAEKEDFESKIAELTTKTDTSHLETELNELREYKAKVFNDSKTQFVERFNNIVQHPNFKKAASEFNLPEKNGETFDWEKLDEDKMRQNIETLSKLDKLEYFSQQNVYRPNGSKFQDVDTTNDRTEIKNRNDIKNLLASGLENYTKK